MTMQTNQLSELKFGSKNCACLTLTEVTSELKVFKKKKKGHIYVIYMCFIIQD